MNERFQFTILFEDGTWEHQWCDKRDGSDLELYDKAVETIVEVGR